MTNFNFRAVNRTGIVRVASLLCPLTLAHCASAQVPETQWPSMPTVVTAHPNNDEEVGLIPAPIFPPDAKPPGSDPLISITNPSQKNKESPQQATGYLNEGVYPLLSSVEQNKLLFVEFFVAFSTLGFDIFGDGLRIAMLAHRGDEVAT